MLLFLMLLVKRRGTLLEAVPTLRASFFQVQAGESDDVPPAGAAPAPARKQESQMSSLISRVVAGDRLVEFIPALSCEDTGELCASR